MDSRCRDCAFVTASGLDRHPCMPCMAGTHDYWTAMDVLILWDERRVSGAAEIVFRPFQIVSRESIIESCKRQSKEDAAIFHAVWMAGTPEGVMALWAEERVTDAGRSQDVP